jgi:adenylate cyclase
MIDSIAVFPFDNVERNPELEYLARGIPETLIRSLSAIEGLQVVARSASFRYLSTHFDACAAARDLKAATVVCGSVISRNGRIAIDVELADVATGLRLWGELYQCAVGDLLDIEDRISQEIAAKLRSRLSREEKAGLRKSYTVNSEAHEFYLRGQFYANKMTEQALAMSVAQFEAALRLDPDYALAHTGLANAHSLYAFLNILPARQVLPKAKEHALQALRIDDELPEAHTALAGVMKTYEWNWDGAEFHYRRALQLNPNYVAGHRFYADYLSASGRHQEACREMEIARRLDPLSLIINMELAWIRYMARDFEGAVQRAQQALELEPHFAPSLHSLGLAYQQLGRTTAAIEVLLHACALSQRHPAALAALACAYASAGNTMRAQEIFRELQASSSHRYVSPYGMALASLAIEMKDIAIDFLETAGEDRDVWLTWLKVEPRWDPLRSEPRFQRLVARIGLSDKL